MEDKPRPQRIVEAARERLARSRARLEQAHRTLDVSQALLMETDEHIRHSRRLVEASRELRKTDERPASDEPR